MQGRLYGPAARTRTWINSLEGYCTIPCTTARKIIVEFVWACREPILDRIVVVAVFELLQQSLHQLVPYVPRCLVRGL